MIPVALRRHRDRRSAIPYFVALAPSANMSLGRAYDSDRATVENIVSGVFTAALAKQSKSFSLIDCVSVGVDRMQRNFEPMRKQVEAWHRSELTGVAAKVVIYEAFGEGKLEAPKPLARTMHDLCFEPKYDEFRPGTMRALTNAFTSAFKELDPPLNSGCRRNWESSWRRGSRSRSSLRRHRRSFGCPFCPAAVARRSPPRPLISQKTVHA